MRETWIAADSIVSPLGYSTRENCDNVIAGKTGITLVRERALSDEPFFAAHLSDEQSTAAESRLERIAMRVVADVMAQNVIFPKDAVLIFSTTKGNISFLEEGHPGHARIHLPALAEYVRNHFGFRRALVVSNACISGVMALIAARRILATGAVDHAVVVGVDVLSKFVVSGFQTLQAMSPEPCRPFDALRKGINLGEAAAAVVLTADRSVARNGGDIRIGGGGLSNDANHISGPSRTGHELALAIQQAMNEAQVAKEQIDFISAHGTGTAYNDEMEAKAFALAAIADKPVHSLKGYYGHTLGAAGVLEVALIAESLRRNCLLPSFGYEQSGVSQPLNVITAPATQPLNTCLKTASGFGGCNAALILTKDN